MADDGGWEMIGVVKQMIGQVGPVENDRAMEKWTDQIPRNKAPLEGSINVMTHK